MAAIPVMKITGVAVGLPRLNEVRLYKSDETLWSKGEMFSADEAMDDEESFGLLPSLRAFSITLTVEAAKKKKERPTPAPSQEGNKRG